MKDVKVNAPVVQTFAEHLPQPFIDESENGTYYGWAPIGTDESEAGWRIMFEKKDGNVTKRLYAQGSMAFEFKWSERTNYSYSR